MSEPTAEEQMEKRDLERKKTRKSVMQVKTPHCCRCRNHGIVSILKGHKWFCPWRRCVCESCMLTARRQQTAKEQVALKRHWKLEEDLGILAPVEQSAVSGSLQTLSERYPMYNIGKLNAILKSCQGDVQQAMSKIEATVDRALEKAAVGKAMEDQNNSCALPGCYNQDLSTQFSTQSSSMMTSFPKPLNVPLLSPLPPPNCSFPTSTTSYLPTSTSCMNPYPGNFPFGGTQQGFMSMNPMSYPPMRTVDCYNGMEPAPNMTVPLQNPIESPYCQDANEFESESDYQEGSPVSVTSNDGQIITINVDQ